MKVIMKTILGTSNNNFNYLSIEIENIVDYPSANESGSEPDYVNNKSDDEESVATKVFNIFLF
jgi:hypothetical protein